MMYSMPVTQKLRKLVKSLYQKQHRENNGLFVTEGEKMVNELLNSDYEIQLVVARESPTASAARMFEEFADLAIPTYHAPKHVFDQMCDAKSPQSILAVSNVKNSIIIPNQSFIALDAVADPGNVGTVIRTADWFGYKQVILSQGCADKLNPKVLRAAMGAHFRMQIIHTEDLYETLQENFKDVKTYGAELSSENNMDDIQASQTHGIIFGSESHGISERVQSFLTDTYKITGMGKTESLNVAIAAGISMYHFAKSLK